MVGRETLPLLIRDPPSLISTMVGSETLPLLYLELAKQCGFRSERGTEIRESQINLTCAPTCLYVLYGWTR